MKVYYRSAFHDQELTGGDVYRAIPCKAYLEWQREKNESPCDLLLGGSILDPEITRVDCDGAAELIVLQNGEKSVYSVKPLLQPLSAAYAKAYKDFLDEYEYEGVKCDEIQSIHDRMLKLYAVDQSTEVRDWTDVFDRLKDAFPPCKAICEKPKSHLKSVNEVRPIETVKRIGYESIPYLAAHSEDWLARTAGGLKPARLFSRVEDDEYQIYENRVVKTLIDLIIHFLRKTEKQLRDQRDQLRGIIDSSVQTGSFGFDESFQKAVHELISYDDKGDAYRSKKLELVEKFQKQAEKLLKRYRTLRQTKLYRYLKKSKPIKSPLKETNILVMDRQYSVLFKLWKTLHRVLAPQVTETSPTAGADVRRGYQQFCATLCGYAAYRLGFRLIAGRHYVRDVDHMDLAVQCTEDGLVRGLLKDRTPRQMEVSGRVEIPIEAGGEAQGFSYDGRRLSWHSDVTDEEIEAFCGIFKKKGSRGRQQSEEKRKYRELKAEIDQAQRAYGRPVQRGFVMLPLPVEIETENRAAFLAEADALWKRFHAGEPETQIIVALPICNDNEQKVIRYAKEAESAAVILPLTMFDINSYRRVQNLLYRQILVFEKETCPNCGGTMSVNGNQRVCNHCNRLMLTKTQCPNPACRHEYTYMGYEVSEKVLKEMQKVKPEDFFAWDSLYQYKDIVAMTVDSGKVRTICPFCHQG